MSRVAVSIFVAGMYLGVLGLLLVITPNTLLSLFGFPPTDEVWIRVVGLLVIVICYYSVTAARAESMPFFRSTLVTRPFLFLAFAGLVLLHLVSPMLVLFGAVELAGAAWTWSAMRGASGRLAAR